MIVPDANPVKKDRSPTETLVHCLEDFGTSEPVRVIVIYLNSDGEICWSTSGPHHFSESIGMLECVRARIMQQFLKDD